MWREKHLPAVPAARTDASGTPVTDVMAQSNLTLEELEKAHIYIEQLNDRVRRLEEEKQALASQLSAIDARLAALEGK